jgi:hypothetical protein
MSSTLARHWMPERWLVGDDGRVVAFSLFTGLMAAAAVLPAGWRLSRSR